MKPLKMVFFVMAGIWILLLFFEKISHSTHSGTSKKTFKPLRLLFAAVSLVKSILLLSLVVFNVFMAIALIEDKK